MLSALVLLAASQPDQLAFIARFYKPGKAKSSYHIYLSALDGSKRRQLPFDKDAWRVGWLGKDRLAIVSDEGIYVGAVTNWKPKLIPGSKGYGFVDSRDRINPPGEPQLTKDDEATEASINPQTLTIQPTMKQPTHTELSAGEDGKYTVTEPNGGKLNLEVGEPFDYLVKGKVTRCDWSFRRGWESPRRGQLAPHRLFLLASDHNSTNGDVNMLLLFEKSKQPRAIFENANAFDFFQGRNTYAYCTPRDTLPLNPKDKNSKLIWTSQLHVGDWLKGTDRVILSGAVHAVSVSIRP